MNQRVASSTPGQMPGLQARSPVGGTHKIFLKIGILALAGVAQWIECGLQTKGSLV